MKKTIMSMLCFVLSLFLWTGTVNAAAAKSTYTIKNGSYLTEKTVSVKAGSTNTITLKVNEKGTLKFIATRNSKLTGKEEIKVRLVNAKGKTVKTTYVKKSGEAYVTADVSKGTYKVMVSTKNIKKNTVKKINFGFTMNKEITLRADNKTARDIVNTKGQLSFKLVNDKSQTVRIRVGEEGEASKKDKMIVKDTKGNVVYTATGTKDGFWEFFYLAKGTYNVSYTGGKSRVEKIVVKKSNEYTQNMVVNPTSKAKAAVYTGKSINLVNTGKQKASLWLKIDTTNKDFVIDVVHAVYGSINDAFAYGTLYKEDGSRVVDYGILNESFKLNKGTGVYYLEVKAGASQVIAIEESYILGTVTTDDTKTIADSYANIINVKSDADKVVTGTITTFNEAYIAMETEVMGDGTMAELYDKDGKRVATDVDGLSRVKAGTYQFKTKMREANKQYMFTLGIFPLSDLKALNLTYLTNKTATVELSGLEANYIYSFGVGAIDDSISKNSYTVYEDGKKIASVTNKEVISFHVKEKKKYKVVVKSSKERMVTYTAYPMIEFKMPGQKLKASKKAATTYKITDKKQYSGNIVVKGKNTGWMKITNTTKKPVYITTYGIGNQGSASVKIYNSKGQVKKTLNVKPEYDMLTSYQGDYKLGANQSCYVKVESTNKNTDLFLKIISEQY